MTSCTVKRSSMFDINNHVSVVRGCCHLANPLVYPYSGQEPLGDYLTGCGVVNFVSPEKLNELVSLSNFRDHCRCAALLKLIILTER